MTHISTPTARDATAALIAREIRGVTSDCDGRHHELQSCLWQATAILGNSIDVLDKKLTNAASAIASAAAQAVPGACPGGRPGARGPGPGARGPD